MIVKNLTCKSQKLVVKEIIGDHTEYDMIFQPKSAVELDRLLTVVHPEKYSGVFEFETCSCHSVVETNEVAVEVKEPEVSTEEEPETVPDVEEVKEPEVAPDSFICDICGSEFASARGLANHKNKAHSE